MRFYLVNLASVDAFLSRLTRYRQPPPFSPSGRDGRLRRGQGLAISAETRKSVFRRGSFFATRW